MEPAKASRKHDEWWFRSPFTLRNWQAEVGQQRYKCEVKVVYFQIHHYTIVAIRCECLLYKFTKCQPEQGHFAFSKSQWHILFLSRVTVSERSELSSDLANSSGSTRFRNFHLWPTARRSALRESETVCKISSNGKSPKKGGSLQLWKINVVMRWHEITARPKGAFRWKLGYQVVNGYLSWLQDTYILDQIGTMNPR